MSGAQEISERCYIWFRYQFEVLCFDRLEVGGEGRGPFWLWYIHAWESSAPA